MNGSSASSTTTSLAQSAPVVSQSTNTPSRSPAASAAAPASTVRGSSSARSTRVPGVWSCIVVSSSRPPGGGRRPAREGARRPGQGPGPTVLFTFPCVPLAGRSWCSRRHARACVRWCAPRRVAVAPARPRMGGVDRTREGAGRPGQGLAPPSSSSFPAFLSRAGPGARDATHARVSRGAHGDGSPWPPLDPRGWELSTAPRGRRATGRRGSAPPSSSSFPASLSLTCRRARHAAHARAERRSRKASGSTRARQRRRWPHRGGGSLRDDGAQGARRARSTSRESAPPRCRAALRNDVGARRDGAARVESADTGVLPRAAIHAGRGRCNVVRKTACPGRSVSG